MLIYERLRRNMTVSMLIFFGISTLSFAGAFFINQSVVNIIMMISAILFANCAANILWSVYCPGLRDTGMVSAATGFLNFVSYMSASISNTIFGNAVAVIVWGKLVFVWFALMAVGIVIMFPLKKGNG
jgi:sugar phosphate permease